MNFRRRHIVARFARVWGALRSGSQAEAGAPPALSDSQILDRFEGIGDSCEFAALQRLAGVDRLALFKWAGSDPVTLAELIESDLRGLDDPTLFRLRVEERAGAPSEYMIDHHLLRCTMHSFTGPDDDGIEEAHGKQARRLLLLGRKFLDEARAARRIYVYHSLAPRADQDIDRLFAALRRLGPNRMLFVTPPDAALNAGEVVLKSPDFAVGALDNLACYHTATTIRSKMWPTLLRRALSVLGEPAPC